MNILLTGGLGYIGSNLALRLLKKNHKIVIIDNLRNSKRSVIAKINKLSKKKVLFFKSDCKNEKNNIEIIKKNNIEIVIHLAGLKAVSESMKYPKKYMRENFLCALGIIKAMQKTKVNKIIFSSSATVYGKPKYLPVDEYHATEPEHAYGLSKLLIEKYLNLICKIDKSWSVVALRYFNPVGSDKSGQLKEYTKKPKNLFPNILKIFLKEKKFLNLYGKNYATKDGTAIRDYIHILDLINSHIASIKYLRKKKGFSFFNVGTGIGYTVLEIIKKFEITNKTKINIKIKPRRAGDVPIIYASAKKIKKKIGWSSKYKLNEMCYIKK